MSIEKLNCPFLEEASFVDGGFSPHPWFHLRNSNDDFYSVDLKSFTNDKNHITTFMVDPFTSYLLANANGGWEPVYRVNGYLTVEKQIARPIKLPEKLAIPLLTFQNKK